MPRRLGLVVSLLALAAAAFGLPAAHAATPSYVALGDSYSSGVGTRTYLNDGSELPTLGLRLPEPDRGSARLLAELPGLLGRDGGRRPQHPAQCPHCQHVVRDHLRRRQRCGLRRRPHRVRPARLGQQLQRGRRRRPALHREHPARRRSASLYSSIHSLAPSAKVVVVGYPRIFNGEDCNALTWFSPSEETRLNQTADQLERPAERGRLGCRLRVRQPDLGLHRPRRLRVAGVAQRALQPDQRVLPPEPHRPRERLHPAGQPQADRRRRHRHRGHPRRGARLPRAASPHVSGRTPPATPRSSPSRSASPTCTARACGGSPRRRASTSTSRSSVDARRPPLLPPAGEGVDSPALTGSRRP